MVSALLVKERKCLKTQGLCTHGTLGTGQKLPTIEQFSKAFSTSVRMYMSKCIVILIRKVSLYQTCKFRDRQDRGSDFRVGPNLVYFVYVYSIFLSTIYTKLKQN